MELSNKNPFIPPQTKKTFIFSVINCFIALIKLPFMLFAFLISFSYAILSTFIPINTLKRIVIHSTSSVLFRIMLGFTGIYSVNKQPTPLIDTFSNIGELHEPQPGDIIISNFASYLNIFWLQNEYSPIFAIPINENDVYVFNAFQLLTLIFSSKKITSKVKVSLNDLIKSARNKYQCPIVIFPESVPTNGQFIINFQPFGKNIDEKNLNLIHFHIFGFIHFNSSISPNFTFGNIVLHLLSMVGRIVSGLKVKIALQQDIPLIKNQSIDDEYIEKCRQIMSSITGLPTFDAGCEEFEKVKNYVMKKKQHND
ncbi:hypothetical protein TRFO_09275 [Tritrichomonas foetus]|uniref:Phospholipid/glycerol acyltransferase domain-containing protein n=1 Tax=Tritrichomonas foetus TaxID=1144522 RepID=A0A1J4JF56_9EUKA|nr:hypothetical protein TRFO_09275 [Tritrichomonas foetus]|eukprot:OHS97838.1 hypothetical protein TRFO_09275 [Tritrichomonas foetus]